MWGDLIQVAFPPHRSFEWCSREQGAGIREQGSSPPLIRVVQLAIKRLLVGKLLPRRLEVAGARSLLLIEGHQLSLVITVRLGILIDSRSCGRG